jgi:hypothetical protein
MTRFVQVLMAMLLCCVMAFSAGAQQGKGGQGRPDDKQPRDIPRETNKGGDQGGNRGGGGQDRNAGNSNRGGQDSGKGGKHGGKPNDL